MSDEGMSDADLGRALYEEMCRLDPDDDPAWDDLRDHDRYYYKCSAERVLFVAGMRLDAAERERDALREALKRYGACSYSCASNVILTSLPPKRQPCDCGYRAALTANHSAPVVEE